MTLPISVIIVNYNAGAELTRCVDSLIEASRDIEIIVVDNSSQDDSIKQLRLAYSGLERLIIIQNIENMGFAVACNQGSRTASGDFFLYLNPDCMVEPTTMDVLLHHLKNNPGVGMAGGLILNHDGTEQRGCRRLIPTPWTSLVNSFGLQRLARFNKKFLSDFRLDRQPLPENPVPVEAISGACMMVRKEAYEVVGPMDEGYFLHCEDLDWCMQFRNHGWEIAFVPQARLYHSKGTCSSSRPVFVEWNKHRGMVRFYNKFFHDQYPKPMLWMVWCGIWLRFGISLARLSWQNLFRAGKNSD